MTHGRPDPPMAPMPDSIRWFESSPDPIEKDLDTALLIVRVGMASNALMAQIHAATDAGDRPTPYTAAQTRDVVLSFVICAALTNESIRLAQEGMRTLRSLASRAGATGDLLDQMGQLCAGKHPASFVLSRARNQLAFHWDFELIRESLLAFTRNQSVVWIESDKDFHPVHSLAFAVVHHALFPDADQPDTEASKRIISQWMSHISNAMDLIIEFFTASVYGYMKASGIEQRSKP